MVILNFMYACMHRQPAACSLQPAARPQATGLQPGHKYEVTLDGQPVGQSSSGSITVNNVFRGTHEARAHIVDENGVQVKTGSPITFTVHRPSALN